MTFGYSLSLRKNLESIEEMKEAVTKVIDTLTREDFHGAFQKLLERYTCITAGGDYFEGDKSFMCVLSIKVPIRKKFGRHLVILVSDASNYSVGAVILHKFEDGTTKPIAHCPCVQNPNSYRKKLLPD